jgi:1-acyl-sn-glycerol-3-phosphate acyltransferase
MTDSPLPGAERASSAAHDFGKTKLKTGIRVAASFAVLSAGALVMLAAAIPTLGLARRFYSEVIGRAIGSVILRLWGIHHVVHRSRPLPAGQAIYISNHTSTIDLFLLIALALPRTRFFMFGAVRRIVPLGVIGYLIRIFWTAPQEFPEKRRRIFARADRILRRSGDSVYLSPEGMRVVNGEVGHFNKGSFHLATSLHAPLIPIYIAIPREINPGMGYEAQPGRIDLWFLRPIETDDWRLDDLEKNRDAVRNLYVHVHDTVRATGRPPAELVA